jgi:hypothetical protein
MNPYIGIFCLVNPGMKISRGIRSFDITFKDLNAQPFYAKQKSGSREINILEGEISWQS